MNRRLAIIVVAVGLIAGLAVATPSILRAQDERQAWQATEATIPADFAANDEVVVSGPCTIGGFDPPKPVIFVTAEPGEDTILVKVSAGAAPPGNETSAGAAWIYTRRPFRGAEHLSASVEKARANIGASRYCIVFRPDGYLPLRDVYSIATTLRATPDAGLVFYAEYIE
ncbi:MAG: hypothetical protein ABUS48_07345 [Pseudomonadota bacterium]